MTIKSLLPIIVVCLRFTSAQADPSYVSFDVPGAVTDLQTSALSDDGFICGYFGDADSNGHAFIRTGDGTITIFDVPGAYYTDCTDINDKHEAVGDYTMGGGGIGYTRSESGHFSTFAVEGAFGTEAASVNLKGSVSGYYIDSNRQPVGGFVRSRQKEIETFQISDAVYGPVVGAINKYGAVTGDFTTGLGDFHGFIRQLDGSLITYEVPNTNSVGAYLINDKGSVAGGATDAATYSNFGFLRTADGTLTTFSVPHQYSTYVSALNNRDEIVGTYGAASGNGSHGFLRARGGKIRRIDYPGAIGTVVSAINDHGVVAGYYLDSSYGYHGFLRTP